jgi:predicted NBD/HSP70 family sugar kinase
MPGWSGFPIHRRLGERFGALVLVANEVHLMALGELRRGHGVGRDDLLFVKIGTGIGAGVCVGGRLHRGASGYAGDIGHVAVSTKSSIICRCGNTGCLEALAGGAAIARDGLLGARSGRSAALAQVLAEGTEITAAHVGAAAGLGDPYSIELISRCGRLVGETLATLITGVDPSLVVVGGGVAQSGTVLLAAIRDGIYRRSRSLATENLVLVGSELGKTAGLVGGALAALDHLFDPDYLKRWIQHGRPIAEPVGQFPSLVPAPLDVDHVDEHADSAMDGARPAVVDHPAPAPDRRVTVGLQRRTG